MKHKLLNLSDVGLKFASNGDATTFSGYASVFNGLDAYGDMIAPGAYSDTLKERSRPIRMRWNHFGPVIGKYTHIEEDEKGLYVEGELTPGHSTAMDVAASMRHGSVDGLSIGYIVRDYEDRGDARLLKQIDLVEISVVEEPADEMALIGSVKNFEQISELKELEKLLRDAGGFSRKEAMLVISTAKRLVQSDSDADKAEVKKMSGLFESLNKTLGV